ncbi:MAG: sugar phosphate isomerase/epimerase [Candidatus Margulisbacteria bacterium]|nr:sugar phosphate isomerase/epimerase [Candidatus Margulisiibacteriota bacterium]MBU1617135.1 sugar phosphate isomerase/epimerase [Candidatus Margulisiibacteriota bacterium]
MADIKLGINTGFALNRYSAPEDWTRVVGRELGLKYVQLTADLINPSLPDKIVASQIKKIRHECRKNSVVVAHTFTGAFTRVNHLAHPDEKIAKYWLGWFKRFVDISVALEAESLGSHFGIFSVPTMDNATRRREVFARCVEHWQSIAAYAKKQGLKYLTWEPMSIPREMGETIAETRRIQLAVNDGSALPIRLCLDVDHGDVASRDPRDTDPYAWIAEFGRDAPLIHIKQSLIDKGGHWPFLPDKNKAGKIKPQKVLRAINDSGARDVLLLLELSFREREPYESRVLRDLRTSVKYWQPFVAVK